jgi:hypothetical protein
MRQIMAGEISPVMTAAILAGLRVKKETIGEITAAAMVMRELSTKVPIDNEPNLVDIVGTGGDLGEGGDLDDALRGGRCVNLDQIDLLFHTLRSDRTNRIGAGRNLGQGCKLDKTFGGGRSIWRCSSRTGFDFVDSRN